MHIIWTLFTKIYIYMLKSVMSDLGILQTTFTGLLCQFYDFLLDFLVGCTGRRLGGIRKRKATTFLLALWLKSPPQKKNSPFFFPHLGAILSCLLRVCMTLPFSEIWPPAPWSPSKELQDSNHQSSFLQFPIPKSSSFFQHLLSLEYSMFSFFSYSFLRLVEQIPHIK